MKNNIKIKNKENWKRRKTRQKTKPDKENIQADFWKEKIKWCKNTGRNTSQHKPTTNAQNQMFAPENCCWKRPSDEEKFCKMTAKEATDTQKTRKKNKKRTAFSFSTCTRSATGTSHLKFYVKTSNVKTSKTLKNTVVSVEGRAMIVALPPLQNHNLSSFRFMQRNMTQNRERERERTQRERERKQKKNTHTHIYIYIYIYREREKWERKREREREREKINKWPPQPTNHNPSKHNPSKHEQWGGDFGVLAVEEIQVEEEEHVRIEKHKGMYKPHDGLHLLNAWKKREKTERKQQDKKQTNGCVIQEPHMTRKRNEWGETKHITE